MPNKFKEFHDEQHVNEMELSEQSPQSPQPPQPPSEAPAPAQPPERPTRRFSCRSANCVFCALIVVSLVLSVGAFWIGMAAIPMVRTRLNLTEYKSTD
jgi:ferric-dicitrate binding protein FerR (iron transport regulator)